MLFFVCLHGGTGGIILTNVLGAPIWYEILICQFSVFVNAEESNTSECKKKLPGAIYGAVVRKN